MFSKLESSTRQRPVPRSTVSIPQFCQQNEVIIEAKPIDADPSVLFHPARLVIPSLHGAQLIADSTERVSPRPSQSFVDNFEFREQ